MEIQESHQPNLLLREYLKRLRLPAMAREFERVAREAGDKSLSYERFLLALAEQEVTQREQNARRTRLSRAKFPIMKTLDSFDFGAVGSISKQKILQLCQGDFIDQGENLLLIGSSGVGKTHLAIAIGISLCMAGKTVRFFTVSELVNLLLLAQKEQTLLKLQSKLDKFSLIIIDEMGYVSLSRSAAEMLFTFCASRYERRSLCITSNLEFSAWEDILGDPRMTAALVDRLTHRAHILVMNGESYRFKESLKRVRGDDPPVAPPKRTRGSDSSTREIQGNNVDGPLSKASPTVSPNGQPSLNKKNNARGGDKKKN